MKKTVKNVLFNLLLDSFIILIIASIFKIVINNQFKVGNSVAVAMADSWYKLKYNYPVNMTYVLLIILAVMLYFIINKLRIIARATEYIKKNSRLLKAVFLPIGILLACYVAVALFIYILRDFIYLYCNNFIGSTLSDVESIWHGFDREYGIDLTFVSQTIIVLFIYYKIYGKRIRELLSIVNDTKNMAEGNIDTLIDDKKYKDFKELSNNINDIVLSLKDMTKKEKQSQQTKNDLITNVSHDLRTPLTIILGYLGIIDNDKYEDEVKLRYYVSIANAKAKELNVLTNDLFELTKMQGNAVELTRRRINIVELVGQITSQFNLMLENNNMVSRLSFCDEKLFVDGDGEMLARVFNNLISNSIKYGSDGRFLDVSVYRNDDCAVIDVANYGEEIAPDELPYIFDRLYRVEKSRNRETGGSGLGLAIAKEIIEMHGGTIAANSSREKTVFEVKLNLINLK